AVLPDNGVIQRPAGVAIPHQRRLKLSGNSGRKKLAGAKTRLLYNTAGTVQGTVPDCLRTMLHPTRLRKNLGKLLLLRSQHGPVRSKENRATTGGTLIQTKQITCHDMFPAYYFFISLLPHPVTAQQ